MHPHTIRRRLYYVRVKMGKLMEAIVRFEMASFPKLREAAQHLSYSEFLTADGFTSIRWIHGTFFYEMDDDEFTILVLKWG